MVIGLLDELPPAGALARPRAHAPEDAREGQVLAQHAHPGLVVARRDVPEELRDLDVRGAGVAAGRRAERRVIAEQQLEVELADGAQFLGLRGDDEAVGDLRVAGRDRVVAALHVDDAEATGGDRVEAVVLAERRDLDARGPGGLEDGGAGFGGDLPPVDGEVHARLLGRPVEQPRSASDLSASA